MLDPTATFIILPATCSHISSLFPPHLMSFPSIPAPLGVISSAGCSVQSPLSYCLIIFMH